MTHDEPFQNNYIIRSYTSYIFFVPTCRLQNGGATMFPYRLCASPERELHHEVWWDLGCLQTSAYSPWWPAPSSLESEANRTYHSLIENRPYPNMKNGPRSIYRNSICQLQGLYYTDASGLCKKARTPFYSFWYSFWASRPALVWTHQTYFSLTKK